MALTRISCPECSAGLKSPDGFSPGETVCCPKCDTYFEVEDPEDAEELPAKKKKKPAAVSDDDDDDDRPRKKKKKKRGKEEDEESSYKNSPLRYAILGALIIVMIVLAYFLYDKYKKKADSEEPAKPEPTEFRPVPLPQGGPAPMPNRPPVRAPGGPKGGPAGAAGANAGQNPPQNPAKVAPLELTELRGVDYADFSPDSRQLVTAQQVLQPPGKKTVAVQLWNLSTGRQTKKLIQYDDDFVSYSVFSVFSQSGKSVACILKNWTEVRVWDLEKGGDPVVIPVPKEVPPARPCFIHFSPDGTELFITGRSVYRVALATRSVTALEGVNLKIGDVFAFSPTAPILAKVSAGKQELTIVNTKTAELKEVPLLPGTAMRDVAFSGDGKILALIRTNAVQLLDTATWKLKNTLSLDDETGKKTMLTASLSRDARTVVAVAITPGVRRPGQLELWSAPDYTPTTLSEDAASAAMISPDGKMVAYSRPDSGFYLIDSSTGKPITFGP